MKLVRLILLAVFLANAGFAQQVWHKFDPNANFSKYKTYTWLPNTAQLDPLTDQQLKTAIDAGLAKKGLVKTEGAEADLLISFQVAFRKPMEFTASTDLPGPGVYVLEGRRWDYDPTTQPIGTTTTTETLQIGDFGLDMYDAAQRQLVWRGDAAKTIEADATPDKRKKNIEKGVAKLLKGYPPRNKK